MTSLLMTADAVGGVWQYALELAGGLIAQRGYRVDVAVLGPAPAAAQREAMRRAGATLIDTGLAPDWLASGAAEVERTAATVAAIARARGADLVHLNQPSLAVARFDVPVLAMLHSCVASWWEAVEHGPLPADFAWQTALIARGLAAADAIACPSAAFSNTTQRLYRLPRPPAVVRNGRAMPAAGATLHDVVYTSGRLWDRGKNVAVLDRAAARLGLPFKAAGAIRGPNGGAIALDHLEVLGHVSDATIAGLLSARPIFASAARYEPFGLSVLEAAASGCALVLSDIPTFRELWAEAAVFVPADDADGFAAAIEGIAADPQRRRDLGEQARARAACYSPAAMVSATADLHTRLLERAGDRAAA